MKIRRVDPNDPEVSLAIRELHEQTFPEDKQPGLHGDWWLAWSDGEPVAFAGMWASLSLPGAGYLCRAGVLPGARGQGLQRRLILARERAARRKGWNALLSDTAPGNLASANNLIRTGFELYRPPYEWALPGALYWRKIIGDAG